MIPHSIDLAPVKRKRKPTLQELADDGVLKAQAARFATRTPIPYDAVIREILRTIPDNRHAADELDAVVAQAERGRAWHPAMGVSWGTAEQAAQR